jgi:hypothetical protein
MIKIGQKIALPATSLLVTYWTGNDFYKTTEVVDIINSLDLQGGKEIAEKFKPVWPHFDQAIQNRKFAILQFVKFIVEQNKNQFQLVNLGAGVDPLSLEISITHNIPIAFDVDFDTKLLKYKSELVSKLKSEFLLKFVAANISNKEELRRRLIGSGWDSNKKTIVIAEGVSYYLKKDTLWNSLELFHSPHNDNYLIFEYYKQDKNVDIEFQEIAKKGFGLVYEDTGVLTRYDIEAIRSQLRPWKGNVVDIYTLKRAESERYGFNKIFPNEKSGWAEIALCKI